MVGEKGDPFYLKFWVNRPSSASAVTPSKKVQLSLIGSPLFAFQ